MMFDSTVSGESTTSASLPVELVRLRYEHTLRALDRHTVILNELRNRSSIILSATGVVASLFARQTLTDPHPAVWAAAALLASGGGLVCCIAVLLPVADKGRIRPHQARWVPWRRRPRAWKVILGRSELERLPWRSGETAVLTSMIEVLEPARLVNYRTLGRRTLFFNAACVFLPLQILFWVLVILF
jgi:hypothetical protein